MLITLVIISVSCKVKYDYRQETDAANQIMKDIQSKKIIFIGDNHTDVFPLSFITKNLENFYNAGVRYIFLEEQSDNYINNPQEIAIHIMPPWGTWGQKYEYLLFEDEIKRINEAHKDDPLITIWPETGLEITDEDLIMTWNDVMNMRDSYAQKNITTIMDNTDKKGLIFYGNAHGLKKPEIDDENQIQVRWKMIGSYMDEHYGKDFSTYILYNFCTDSKKRVIYQNKSDCKIIPAETFNLWNKIDAYEKKYDYECVYENIVYGVPDCYVPEKNILNFMISLLYGSNISRENKISPQSKKSQQLFAVYYLKYHLGDKFNFDWNMSEQNLYESVGNLKKTNLQSISYNLKDLEEYMKYLFSNSEVENYLLSYPHSLEETDRCLKDIEFYLPHAQKLNPRDIWPQYWIAYFQTDKANYSGKKSDYKTALKSWEKLLENDLVYASPVLKLVYQKMALCSEKSGDVEKSAMYRSKADNVNPLLDIDFKEYVYFGY